MLASKLIRTEVKVRGLGEKDLLTTCPTCQTGQTLDEAGVTQTDTETVYLCKNDEAPILILSTPPLNRAIPGRGYRIRDWVLRNPTDLYVTPPGKAGSVMFDASPAALDEIPPEVQDA